MAVFRDLLNMEGVQTGASFSMRNGTFGKVDLHGAEIKGQLVFDGSTFDGELAMGSVFVGSMLSMGDGATLADPVGRGVRGRGAVAS